MGNSQATGIAYGDPDFPGPVSVAGVLTPSGGVLGAYGTNNNPRVIHTGNQPPLVSTDGTNATPVATETYISQVFLPANMLISGISIFNGATVGTDKVFVYLCDHLGNVVASSAAAGVTTVGADSYQDIPLTATYVAKGPANYYVCVQFNGTTTRYNAHTFGRFGASKATGTTFGTPVAITVPTTFTTAVAQMATLY